MLEGHGEMALLGVIACIGRPKSVNTDRPKLWTLLINKDYDEILLTVVPRDGQISFNDFKSRLNTEYNLSLNKVNEVIQRCQELIDD